MADELDKKLDSPLVVHKESDASYEECANEMDIVITHSDDGGATLERHRFRKVKKKKKSPYFIAAFVIVVVIITALCYKGVLPNPFDKETTTTDAESTSSVQTTEENKFEGVITVKGSYLFFEGKEINGTEELIAEIKYVDKEKHFIVQDEKADSKFLNNEVIETLTAYGIDYEVIYIHSSGLMSEKETTTLPPETTSAPSLTEPASDNVNNNTEAE